jgi:hypothetical protein
MRAITFAAIALLLAACSPEVVYIQATPEVVYATPEVVYVTPEPTATPTPEPTPVSGCLDPRNAFVTLPCPFGVPDGSYIVTAYVYCEKWEPYSDGVRNVPPAPQPPGSASCPDGWTEVP